MKYILLLAGLFFCSIAFSQSEYVKKDVEKFETLYNLDEGQVELVEDLLTNKEADLLLIINSEDEIEVKRAKRQGLKEAYEKKFVAILNDEQKVAHEKIKLATKAAKKDRRVKKKERTK